MSNKTLNSYPSEFKESAVKLALESTHPITQTARELFCRICLDKVILLQNFEIS